MRKRKQRKEKKRNAFLMSKIDLSNSSYMSLSDNKLVLNGSSNQRLLFLDENRSLRLPLFGGSALCESGVFIAAQRWLNFYSFDGQKVGKFSLSAPWSARGSEISNIVWNRQRGELVLRYKGEGFGVFSPSAQCIQTSFRYYLGTSYGLAVSDNLVYIGSRLPDRILVFSLDGRLVRSWRYFSCESLMDLAVWDNQLVTIYNSNIYLCDLEGRNQRLLINSRQMTSGAADENGMLAVSSKEGILIWQA